MNGHYYQLALEINVLARERAKIKTCVRIPRDHAEFRVMPTKSAFALFWAVPAHCYSA
jgi:hypothetical protein